MGMGEGFRKLDQRGRAGVGERFGKNSLASRAVNSGNQMTTEFATGDWGAATKRSLGGDLMGDAPKEFDKKFISGDWDQKRQTREAQEEEARKNRETQQGHITDLETRQEEWGTGQRKRIDDYTGAMERNNSEVDSADSAYNEQFGKNAGQNTANVDAFEQQFQKRQEGLLNESEEQSKDASKTYTNLSGKFQSLMEDAERNAQGAMTLQEANDPNNRIAQGVRSMYDQQAQNEGRQGLQDYGVMSALGSQAAAAGMQGPMTLGQQVAMMAASNRQASEAYANTQRRMQGLRDQGLKMGFERSDLAYDRGLQAKDRVRQSLGDIRGNEDWHQGLQSNLRGERSAYGENVRSSKGRAEDTRFRNTDATERLNRDTIAARVGRRAQLDGAKYNMNSGLDRDMLGMRNAVTGARMAKDDAAALQAIQGLQTRIDDSNRELAGKQALLGGAMGAAGQAIGSYFGGPVGGAIGSKAGGPMNNAAATNSAPQQAPAQGGGGGGPVTPEASAGPAQQMTPMSAQGVYGDAYQQPATYGGYQHRGPVPWDDQPYPTTQRRRIGGA